MKGEFVGSVRPALQGFVYEFQSMLNETTSLTVVCVIFLITNFHSLIVSIYI